MWLCVWAIFYFNSMRAYVPLSLFLIFIFHYTWNVIYTVVNVVSVTDEKIWVDLLVYW